MTATGQRALENDMTAFRDRYLADHPDGSADDAGMTYLMSAAERREREERELRQAAVVAMQRTAAEMSRGTGAVRYSIDQSGVRLEITDRDLSVRVRFRGRVTIPLARISAVRIGSWQHVATMLTDTHAGTYEWSFGHRTLEVVNVVRHAIAAARPIPVRGF